MDRMTKWLIKRCAEITGDPSSHLTYEQYLRAKQGKQNVDSRETHVMGTPTNKI